MPDSKTTYWLGRREPQVRSNLDLLWCLRFSSMPRRAVQRELREAVHAYCAFAPGEQALAAKWAATFRQSELLLFDRTRRARWLTEAKDLDHPVAVLAVGAEGAWPLPTAPRT